MCSNNNLEVYVCPNISFMLLLKSKQAVQLCICGIIIILPD